MQLTYRLGDVLTPELLARHDESIRNFLIFEQIAFDPDDLAGAHMTERKIKEMLEELAADQAEDPSGAE